MSVYTTKKVMIAPKNWVIINLRITYFSTALLTFSHITIITLSLVIHNMKHKKKATTNKKPETNICTKRNKVSFSAATEIINAQSQRITKDELVNKWYKRNEIKSFRKDANMVSRAFLFQKIRRKRVNTPSVLLELKTLCLYGLEN